MAKKKYISERNLREYSMEVKERIDRKLNRNAAASDVDIDRIARLAKGHRIKAWMKYGSGSATLRYWLRSQSEWESPEEATLQHEEETYIIGDIKNITIESETDIDKLDISGVMIDDLDFDEHKLLQDLGELTEININGWDFSNKNTVRFFEGCHNLTEITGTFKNIGKYPEPYFGIYVNETGQLSYETLSRIVDGLYDRNLLDMDEEDHRKGQIFINGESMNSLTDDLAARAAEKHFEFIQEN